MGGGHKGIVLGLIIALTAAAGCSTPPTTPAVATPPTPTATAPRPAASAVASGTPAAPGAPAAQPRAPGSGCEVDVAPAPLPGWARAGFAPPDHAVPYVVGERGAILGVLFGQPLSAPPAPDRANKILWVTRDPHPAGPLTITAVLDAVNREIPDGPGPSLVDLPAPGCWRLTLAWAGHTDRVTVAYTRSR